MSPAQFLTRMKRAEPAAAYLFLGAEAYERTRCRSALIEKTLAPEERESGLTQYDLNETSLVEVLDDARSLSLFAPRRVIISWNAESALPRARQEEDQEQADSAGATQALESYLKNPSPGVVLLFEATRFEFEGEDKKKLDRIRKFYSAISETVELHRFSLDEARREAHLLTRQAALTMEPGALELLLEGLGADVSRIAVEIEKLSLYAAGKRTITVEDISDLVPDARVTTMFVLVGALGGGHRSRSLELLDTLSREGEYFPLALSFLSTQFRLALVSKEANLRSPQQIQSHFTRIGIPMWNSRSEQIYQTVTKFSKQKLERALTLIFEADKSLRSPRPDDKVVMEQLILAITA